MLVTSEASIDDLNERLVAKGTRRWAERFRPNGCWAVDAHDEDRIDGAYIAVGQGDEADTAELRHRSSPAPKRCPIPNIDPATAQSSPAVSDTLSTYRSDPALDGLITFGMNAVVARGQARCRGWPAFWRPLMF